MKLPRQQTNQNSSQAQKAINEIGGRKITNKAKVRGKNETECLKFGNNIS